MISTLLLVFCATSLLVWASTFGYWLVLRVCANHPGRPAGTDKDLPAISVVVPVLDEQQFIDQKLRDLQRLEYTAGRLRILFVDGGSSDSTLERIRAFRPAVWPIDLIRISGAPGKADQVSAALRHIDTELVALTDVDATLEPDCIRKLAEALVNDPECAIMGAKVVPVTSLPEEVLHWRIVNSLWRLEGEAFGAAGVSGVCHVMKTSFLGPGARVHSPAEDIELTLLAARSGRRVRQNEHAIAYEHRVPNSLRDMCEFRTRRARDYKNVLSTWVDHPGGNDAARVVRLIRRWQMNVLPWLGVACLSTWVVCAVLGLWLPLALGVSAFSASTAVWLRSLDDGGPGAAGIRAFLVWLGLAAFSVVGVRRGRFAPRPHPKQRNSPARVYQ